MRDYRSEIGKRLAALREQHGMTQSDLAELLDCSVKHISHSERGLSYLSLEKYLFISDYFDCSIQYLLKGDEPAELSTVLPSSMIEVLKGDDEKEKKILLEYLRMYSMIKSTADHE